MATIISEPTIGLTSFKYVSNNKVRWQTANVYGIGAMTYQQNSGDKGNTYSNRLSHVVAMQYIQLLANSENLLNSF